MNNIILCSQFYEVFHEFQKYIDEDPKDLSLLFIDTAAEVGEKDLTWLEKDYQSILDAGFKTTRYTITDKTEDEVRDQLQKHDVVCMGGGNTFYLLQQLQKVNGLKLIQDEVARGKYYFGSSTGAIIAGPDISPVEIILSDELAPDVKGSIGMGLVDFVVIPHWATKDPEWKAMFLSDRTEKIYREDVQTMLLTNYQYIVVRDDGYFKIFSVR